MVQCSYPGCMVRGASRSTYDAHCACWEAAGAHPSETRVNFHKTCFQHWHSDFDAFIGGGRWYADVALDASYCSKCAPAADAHFKERREQGASLCSAVGVVLCVSVRVVLGKL